MIMISKIDMILLEFLIKNSEQQFSIRELARKTSTDYKLIHNSMQRLLKKKLATKEKYGRTYLCKINLNICPKYFVFVENERKEKFLKRHSDISILCDDIQEKTPSPFFIFLIFGSHASKKAHKKSDIDALIIVPKKKDMPLFEKFINNILSIRPFKLHYFVITHRDFTDMLRSKEKINLGKEVFRNHIIIYGAETYYKLLRGAIYD